jgi:hypothetical protein
MRLNRWPYHIFFSAPNLAPTQEPQILIQVVYIQLFQVLFFLLLIIEFTIPTSFEIIELTLILTKRLFNYLLMERMRKFVKIWLLRNGWQIR